MAERNSSSSTTRGNATSGNGAGQTATRSRSSKENTGKMEKQSGEKQGKTSSAKAKKETVNLTFHVTVPEHTAKTKKSVYVAGNFNQLNDKHADWDTQTHKMKKVDATHYTLTVKGPMDTRIEYKYTLGDWDHVELDAHCHDTHNRHVMLRGENTEQTVDDVVQNWRNTER